MTRAGAALILVVHQRVAPGLIAALARGFNHICRRVLGGGEHKAPARRDAIYTSSEGEILEVEYCWEDTPETGGDQVGLGTTQV